MNAFLEKGLDINEKQTTGPFQRTPLQMSVVLNLKEIFDFLLEKGADVNSVDANGNTILFNAVFNYNKDHESYGYYISTLLKNNADPAVKNAHGVSALSLSQDIANSDINKYFDSL
nr:ankyrin repeat domain-containing protein [Chryseobacterium sp.]